MTPADLQIPERDGTFLDGYTESAKAADAEIIALWRQWLAKKDELVRNTEESKAATAKLPEWARPGAPGEKGWPEINTTEPPFKSDVMPWRANKRPALKDILVEHKVFANLAAASGDDDLREEIRALGRARVRAWIARVREQRTWRERVGLTDLDVKGDVLCDQLFEIEERIGEALVHALDGFGQVGRRVGGQVAAAVVPHIGGNGVGNNVGLRSRRACSTLAT